MRNRRWIAIAALVASAAGCRRAEPPAQAEQVLFVCEHGAAKSVIAATYFNELAAKRGLSVRATARGADPQDAPSFPTVDGLRADGLAPVIDHPQPLTAPDVRRSSRFVAFDCDVPAMKGLKAMDTCWNDVPTVSDDYARAREIIRAHVSTLVDEAARAESTRGR